jgi:hypothetical protein
MPATRCTARHRPLRRRSLVTISVWPRMRSTVVIIKSPAVIRLLTQLWIRLQAPLHERFRTGAAKLCPLFIGVEQIDRREVHRKRLDGIESGQRALTSR